MKIIKNKFVFIVFLGFHIQICSGQEINPSFRFSTDTTSIESAIEIIENQSEYHFMYLSSWIDGKYTILDRDYPTIESFLDHLIINTQINYFIKENVIYLTENFHIETELTPGLFGDEEYGNIDISNDDGGHIFSRDLQTASGILDENKTAVQFIGNRKEADWNENSFLMGEVTDKKTGEPLPGVTVQIKDSFKGVTTDFNGNYKLAIPTGLNNLLFSFIGMAPLEKNVMIYSDGNLNVALEEQAYELEVVVIESDRQKNITSTQTGLISLESKTIEFLPMVMGEPDLIKAALTLPGVQTLGEGSGGFNVRGGKVDQNLVLLDGAPIYNTSHFFGFFSVINPSSTDKMDLYKSSIPAQFGGRLSSVMDIHVKNADTEKLKISGGIGPITGKINAEIPIIKNKMSVLASGRSSYSNWVLKRVDDESFSNSQASFYDVVTKLSYQINEKNRLSITGYHSHDDFKLSSDSLIAMNNLLGSVIWKTNISNKWDARIQGSFSQYDFDMNYDRIPEDAFLFSFAVREQQGSAAIGFFPNEKHTFDMGVDVKRFELSPGNLAPGGDESLQVPQNLERERGIESAVYISDDWEISEKISSKVGLRYSGFAMIGAAETNLYAEGIPKSIATQTGTESFSRGESVQNYHGPEWRFTLRYATTASSSIKMAYDRSRQYIHMLSNTASISPTDTWKLSGKHVKPQIGDQFSLGYYKNLKNGDIEISIEGFYKRMSNVLDYKTGASLLLNENIETSILQGDGKSYGVEFLLKKKAGKLNGWLSYTFARSLLQFDSTFPVEQVNGGNWFPTNYDKPHNLNITTYYKFNRRFSISSNFVYNTGRPITYPLAQYDLAGSERIYYSDRNQFRIRDYFRVDLGLNFKGNHKIQKIVDSSFSFSVYNLLGRDNPFSVFFTAEEGEIKGYELAVFANAIPTITYNFEF